MVLSGQRAGEHNCRAKLLEADGHCRDAYLSLAPELACAFVLMWHCAERGLGSLLTSKLSQGQDPAFLETSECTAIEASLS